MCEPLCKIIDLIEPYLTHKTSIDSTIMDNVKLALSAMYSPTAGQDEKKLATNFLELFQKSPEAWEVSHTLLSDPSQPLEFRMFASQTLRSKATFDLLQLPEEAVLQLKNSMLDLLITYASKDKLIRTQLSLALCQLALQFLQWGNPMGDITSQLSSSPELLPALLEFLKILPEELTELNKTPLTDDEFNARTQLLISDNVPHVLLMLKNLSELGTVTNGLLLECLNSWVKECPIESILTIDSLASLIFKSLMDEDLFEKASECLCSVLKETRDIDNYHLIDALYKQLLQVHEFYTSHPERLQDPEIVSALTKLYVEAGEAWNVLIAKNAEHFKPLVAIILECSKYDEDLDVVKYTFFFWYQLKQMLTLPRFESLKKVLLDIYLELISVIIKHLCYPLDQDDTDLFHGDREQEDKFKDFRYEMGDVLKDCCAVVGSQKALNVPFQQVQTFLSQQLAQWQLLEAPLFSMRVMAKEVSPKENTILPVIMNMLVQLPEHPKIRYATTLVLGRYSEWTAKHPEYLEVQLNYIIKGFESATQTERDIFSATSQALMYFCQDCSSLLVNYLDQLFMVYQQVQSHLDVKSTYDLVNGLAHVIKDLPDSEQYKAAETFLTPTVSRLTQLSQNGSLQDDSITSALHDEAEVLSIFFNILRCQSFEEPQFPVANYFIDKLYPLLSQILQKFQKSLKVSEHFVKIFKNVIQGCSVFLTPLLPQLTDLLHEGFRETYFGCYLWVTGVVIREFGDEVSTGQTQNAVYQFGLSQSALFFELLKSNTELDIRDIPDVIEDFFNMANDLLMYFPAKVAGNGQLMSSILESGITSLTTSEEHNPLMACVHFFVDYLSWGSQYPPISFYEGDPAEVQQYVRQFLMAENNGQKLVTAVVNGLIFKFYNDPDGNDLLLKLLTVTPDMEKALSWLHQAVSALPNVSEKEVQKLMNATAVALPNKDNRRIRMSIKDFVSWYTRKNVNSRAAFA